jgi:alpha-beta hydrolase superfamily lysophospholipase
VITKPWQVRQAFLDSLAELKATGRSYLVPPKAPQFGVGHSNGALLHLLINSYEPGATDANVIISYNNL